MCGLAIEVCADVRPLASIPSQEVTGLMLMINSPLPRKRDQTVSACVPLLPVWQWKEEIPSQTCGFNKGMTQSAD